MPVGAREIQTIISISLPDISEYTHVQLIERVLSSARYLLAIA